jgi:hypothetical protein
MNADDPVMESVAALYMSHTVEWLEDDVIRVLVKVGAEDKEFMFDLTVLEKIELMEYVVLQAGDNPDSAGHIHVTDKGRYWAKRWMRKNKIVVL